MIDLYVDGGSSTPHYSDFASAVADLGVGVTVNDDVTITGKENGTLITSSTVLIDHGDTSHYTVKLTVDAGYRITDALKTTPVSKAVADGGFFGIVQNSDCVRFRTGSNVIIEHLYVSTGTGTSSRCFELYTTAQTGNFTVRYCVGKASGSGSQILGRAANPGGAINFIFHNNAFYDVGADALNLGNGDITNYVYCNTIHDCGTYGVYHSGTTTYTYGNAVFRCGTATLYGGMSDDSTNITDDGSRSSTNVSHWAAYIRNGNAGEEDLRVVESRTWCSNLVRGISFEGGTVVASYLETPTGTPSWIDIHADAAYEGTQGIRLTLVGDAIGRYGYRTAIPSTDEGTLSFYFKINSTLAMGTADGFYPWNPIIGVVGGSYLVDGYVLESSGDITIRWRINGCGYTSSYDVYAKNTWYHIKIHMKKDSGAADGEFHVYRKIADGAAGGYTTLESGTGLSNVPAVTSVYPFCGSHNDPGTSGPLYVDKMQWSPDDHGEPDDATTPYGNNATTTYNDKTDQYGVIGTRLDIQGITRPTGNTWLAGAFDVEGGAAPAAAPVMGVCVIG